MNLKAASILIMALAAECLSLPNYDDLDYDDLDFKADGKGKKTGGEPLSKSAGISLLGYRDVTDSHHESSGYGSSDEDNNEQKDILKLLTQLHSYTLRVDKRLARVEDQIMSFNSLRAEMAALKQMVMKLDKKSSMTTNVKVKRQDCPKRDIVVALSGVTKKAQNSRAGTYVYWKQYDGLNAWKSIQGSSAIWFSNDRNQWLIGNRRNIAPHRSFYKNHAGLRTIFYEPCPTGDDWEYWDNGKWFNAPHGTANIRYKG